MPRKIVFLILLLSMMPPSLKAAVFSDDFNYPDGLITNEYAFWNSSDPKAVRSPNWQMDSGSFFAKDQAGWTGLPDDKTPDSTSSKGTNSAIFRLTSRRSDFGDVAVSFSLWNQGLTSTRSTPPVDWDGVHVWLRYQSQTQLYYASVNRRDNTVLIKKKTPGGPSNNGTYYTLSPSVKYEVPCKRWIRVRATVKNEANGSVTIELFINDRSMVRATDNGSSGGPPILKAGKVGIRGDNCNFKIDDFIAESL